MSALLLSLMLTAAPTTVLIRVDLQDALRLPSGTETPPADPLALFIKAPATWVKAGGITDAGKAAVLAKLYGGASWMNGNSDGSTYVVKSFKSKVVTEAEVPADGKGIFWYEVKGDGALDKRGPGFKAPLAPKEPGSLVDHAEPGSVFKQGPKLGDAKAATAWLAKQTVPVKLPVTVKRGQVGFSSHGATCGALTLELDDTALGVALADRAEQACPKAATCELWLIGTFKAGTLSVTKVAGAPSAGERKLGLADQAWFQAGN
ncbi:MAG: hypothetical protein IPJ65_12585 [Archangiaceae bacterium]|nr:hypothetical protein [Archangiaceae bacterium]